MMKVAIVGASGFIGTRVVEYFHLSKIAEVIPVVRSYSSLARIARFDLDSRIAEARDEAALAKAFAGCDYVVHAALGDLSVIMDSVEPVYKAALQAGVKRLVYLSSTAVHGFAPAPGTDESSPLTKKQLYVYSKAKVIAEERLLNARKLGSTEVVILRPGIVYGPRSGHWIAGQADALLNRRAYLAKDGNGICNAIYVDNVVEAIRLSLSADNVDGQAFLISDSETVTWREFYQSLASGLSVDMKTVYLLNESEVDQALTRTWRDGFNDFRATPFMQSILPFFPGDLKSSIKKLLFPIKPVSSPVDVSGAAARLAKPDTVPEMVTLQMSECKLPYTKAQKLLGYTPVVSFNEGMRRAIGWLAFAGYPVTKL